MFKSILYEDDSLIVVNKNSGTPVIPGRGIKDSEVLCRYIEEIRKCKIFIVHRLDRETSGVIVFAKTPDAHRDLCLQFENRKTKKVYLAVVLGKITGSGTIDKPVYEFGSGRMGIDTRGKESQTDYIVKEDFSGASLLEVSPLTGRRHQIRVHLYSIGHPVLGDRLYGDPRPVGNVQRLMLHAYRLTLTIKNGIEKTFCAPTDDLWEQIMQSISLGKLR